MEVPDILLPDVGDQPNFLCKEFFFVIILAAMVQETWALGCVLSLNTQVTSTSGHKSPHRAALSRARAQEVVISERPF